MDLSISPKAAELLETLKQFMNDEVLPNEHAYQDENLRLNPDKDWTKWQVPKLVGDLQAKAKKLGLWNLFLPDDKDGAGLSVLDYAAFSEEMGRVPFSPQFFNCNAPDTGNMEVLYHFGSGAQKKQWLEPLLKGEIRSVFSMTEPQVASSDATNMEATAIIDGDEVVVNGSKWWSTGIGHPDVKFAIFMGKTDPEAAKYMQHSMVIVPLDTKGVKIERMLETFGYYDPPYGHGQIRFDNVRAPKENIIVGPGAGFMIAQGRLGPGRIHHCMRAVGMAERALEIGIKRGLSRNAFGKPLIYLEGNRGQIAKFRTDIDQARLLTQLAAWKIDNGGVKSAMTEISAIKYVIPKVLQDVTDWAMQIHGGLGMTGETPLMEFFITARALRLADGPDEVHSAMITRNELKKYK